MGFVKWLTGRFGGGKKYAEEMITPDYRLIFNSSSNPMALTGPDGGRIIDVNEAWVRTTGINRDRCIGKTALELGVWADPVERKTCYALLEAKGRLVEREIKLLTKGEERIFLASARFIKTPEGRHILWEFRDITEGKLAEEKASRAVSDWKETFGAVNDLVMLLDKDYRITRANSAAVRFFNKPLSEIIGDHCYKLMHGTDLPPDFCPIDKMTKSKSHEEIEINLPGTGTWLLVSVDPILDDRKEITRVVHVVKDITERKNAEEDLKRSESRYKSIIKTTQDGFWHVDEEGHFLDVNDAACRMLGYERDELLKMKIADIEKMEDGARVILHIAKMRASGGDRFETIHRRKDGSLVNVEVITSFIEEADATGRVVVFVRDITERKKAETAIKESEARFRELFNNSNVGVCVYEAVNGGDDFIFKEFNPAAEKFENIKKEDVIGRSVLEVFPGVREFGIFDIFKRVWKTGKPEKMPIKKYKDKRIEGWRENYICRLPSGEVVTIYDDVTEQKQAEERIKDIARFPQENPNPVMRVNCHGEILHANPAAEKMLSAWGARAGKAPEPFVADMIEACKTGRPAQKEVKINERTYLFVISPVPEEKFANIYAIDITERKKSERELELYRANLENLVKERTAELESFSYSVSHDLKAPLRAIDGFVRILADEYGPKFDDEGRRITDVIVENTRNMGRLIDDLLAFSRLGRKEPEITEIDMTEAAGNIGDSVLSGEAGRDIILDVGALPPARGDRAMIELALTNLLSNAVKFTRKSKKAVIEVTGKNVGQEKVYCVKDNGVGFDMRYGEKLFGVFQRLHSAEEFEGTGIGLAIVKRIIAKHGGRVWAEGEVGKGAAFFFSLPKRSS